jgi:hypothetical protein
MGLILIIAALAEPASAPAIVIASSVLEVVIEL